MGTVRGGGIECDKCGVDCKALYGFAMSVDRAAHNYNTNVKEIVAAVDKKYGKHDFVLCWDCTIQMMNIPTLAEKKCEKAREAKAEGARKKLEAEKNEVEAKNEKLEQENKDAKIQIQNDGEKAEEKTGEKS